LVEQLTLNQRVVGSSPTAPTIARAFFLRESREGSPRTKWVSCAVFSDRKLYGQSTFAMFLMVSPPQELAHEQGGRNIIAGCRVIQATEGRPANR
jgi:hypothetical protein